MYRLIGLNTANKIIACCVAASLAFPTLADEFSLVEAFEKADPAPSSGQSEISYNIEGCVFQKTILNLNYCNYMGEGDGHRTIIDHVDLQEVEEIKGAEFNGKFHISFELDYGAPGMAFIISDRMLKGSAGAFERFSERDKAALEAAELNSGTTFSNCDGTLPELQKQRSISMFPEVEPEGWLRLVDLARECRAPKHLKFSDK